ncbi:MAG: hypothetical protein LH645_05390 [Actinomycetia bacterium]|nr:hypothetical protein [Actinomycetes bacterium]
MVWGIAIWQIAMTLIASAADWPAQFGTDGSSPEGAAEWFQNGTALSAPLPFIVAMVVAGVLATRTGRVGVVGDVLAFVVALFTMVASLGEAFGASPVTSPRGVLIVSGVLGVALAVLIIWATVHDLRARRTV